MATKWGTVQKGRFLLIKHFINYYYWARFKFLISLIYEDRINNERRIILDVGCGFGDLLVDLSQLRYDVIGLDVDETSIEKIPIGHKLVNSFVPPFPFKESKFDIVVSIGLTEHVQNENLYVKEVSRVLVEGGTYICTIPVEIGFAGLLRHIVKNLLYPNRKDCKNILDYSLDELLGSIPREKHGRGHKFYNYKYLMKDLNENFSSVTLYAWPKFIPKMVSPLLFAKCKK